MMIYSIHNIQKRNGKRAFTIIEILIAVTLISIISSVIIFRLSGSIQSSKDKRNEAALSALAPIASQYLRRNGTYGYSYRERSEAKLHFCRQDVVARIVHDSRIKENDIWSAKQNKKVSKINLNPLIDSPSKTIAGCVSTGKEFMIWIKKETSSKYLCLDNKLDTSITVPNHPNVSGRIAMLCSAT